MPESRSERLTSERSSGRCEVCGADHLAEADEMLRRYWAAPDAIGADVYKSLSAFYEAMEREHGSVDLGQLHGMIPGSHERTGGPECRCGAAWLYFEDRCATTAPNQKGEGL